MDRIFYILLVVLLFGCKSETIKIYKYPDEEEFTKFNTEILNLDTTDFNFKQITDFIYQLSDQQKVLILQFENKKLVKQIRPYVDLGGLRKSKNILNIGLDSILIDHNYPLSDLPQILKRHYSNNKEKPNYSDNAQSAVIEITLRPENSASDLKTLLSKITLEFENANQRTSDDLQLHIYLDYSKYLEFPIPPKPKKKFN